MHWKRRRKASSITRLFLCTEKKKKETREIAGAVQWPCLNKRNGRTSVSQRQKSRGKVRCRRKKLTIREGENLQNDKRKGCPTDTKIQWNVSCRGEACWASDVTLQAYVVKSVLSTQTSSEIQTDGFRSTVFDRAIQQLEGEHFRPERTVTTTKM